MDYGRRILVESAISRYKRLVDETLFSKKMEDMKKEIIAKIKISNKFIMIN